jgi:hypothetical protein
LRDILLNQAFMQQGIQPIQHVKWVKLETQELANQAVRRMFGGG